MDRDEIIFSGAYKDFKLGVRFDLAGKGNEEVVNALAYISANIEGHAFRFSGIDTGKIAEFAKPSGSGIGAVAAFFEERTASAIKEALTAALPKKDGGAFTELITAADSCLLNQLLAKAKVPFKAAAGATLQPAEEPPGDVIAFIAKYGNWMAIKKLGTEGVQDYEVSAILSGINHTVVNKGFDFAGMRASEASAEAAAQGKRRSYGNIAPCLRQLRLTGAREDAFLVTKVLETLGFKPYASPEMLSNAYPDIKPPKTRGRKPKG